MSHQQEDNHHDDHKATSVNATLPDGTPVWHNAGTIEDVYRLAKTAANGLTKPEAAERLKTFGHNAMTPGKTRTLGQMIWEQFNSIVIYILIGSAVIAGIFKEWIDMGLIAGVVIMNVYIGVAQEGKAEKATQAIKRMVSANAVVMRNHKKVNLAASELVPGDIVHLSAGDRIPADIRWVDTANVQVSNY